MRWLEPWYSAYAMVGMLILGVAPILIPLSIEHASGGSATQVGLVIAAFYIGGLLAPVLGSLADTHGLQRVTFIASFPIMSAAVLTYAFADTMWLWLLSAFVFGGLGSFNGTIASLFIVESKPEPEWNDRLSWFRLSYGAGQVLGLVIAAVTATAILAGWISTAALLALGTILAMWRLPRLKATKPTAPRKRHTHAIQYALGVHHHVSQATAAGAASASATTATSGASGNNSHRLYYVFIVAWLFIMAGIQTFFNVVPLVMRDAFEISPTASSLLFLVGAGIGTVMYPLAGKLANRVGPGVVLLLGLLVTAAAFGFMALCVALDLPNKTVFGATGLVLAATAYSFEVVSATMMIVRLAPGTEGAAVGLLNGLIAAGAVIGAIVPALLATEWGYPAFPAMACAAVVLGGAIAIPLYARKHWVFTATAQSATVSATTQPAPNGH